MERDLQQLANVEEVMQSMTWLAELSIQQALEFLYQELTARYGVPRGQDSGLAQMLWVIGMGKLGGQELNVSSDIDLIYLYEEEGMTDGSQQHLAISNQEFFDCLAKALTQALSEINEYGFVFRVDLRLRPNGAAGFLACSLPMLQAYFATQARAWERFAWVKARLLGEPAKLVAKQAHFTNIVHTFVYRPYWDLKILATLQDMSSQIHAAALRAQQRGQIDIKLLPGGIRDIEFIVQALQLIYAGRDERLRDQSTLMTLDHLYQLDLITSETAHHLHTAYFFLRRLEHRLQYTDDAQTHSLPSHLADQQQLAHSMGVAHSQALVQQLEQVRAQVQHYFMQILFDRWATVMPLSLWEQAMLPSDEVQPLDHTAQLLAASPYQELGNADKRAIDTIMRNALNYVQQQQIAQADKLYMILVRLLDLIHAISSRRIYLTLLVEHPQALTRAIDILSTAQWAATYLTQCPELLNELVEEAQPESGSYTDSMMQIVRTRLFEARHQPDAQMDILRQVQRARTFQILLCDLQGLLSIEMVADCLSELADMLLALALEIVWAQIDERHCAIPKFAIAAYGRLGGKELGYASDLDLVFLYDDAYEGAQQIYTDLARKLIAWLTTYTDKGVLYDIDLRLRPNGDAGLLVTDFAAFQRYQLGEGEDSHDIGKSVAAQHADIDSPSDAALCQESSTAEQVSRCAGTMPLPWYSASGTSAQPEGMTLQGQIHISPNSAWLWEHQALVRARFCAGDRQIGAAFEQVRIQVLCQARDPENLRQEILQMRTKMLKAHQASDTEFDIKHSPGGMIDVEFIVQYLVLLHSKTHPQLRANVGNTSLLYFAAEANLLDSKIAQQVVYAYRALRMLQHQYRLNGIAHPRIAQENVPVACHAVRQLWHSIFLS
jgi:glutamate-ammonia-ligase adenylyltransferase